MFFNGKYSILKKMRYVADQKGIIDRYIKEANAWANHLENTKQAIINGAQGRTGGNCAILGSGWLLDVPLEFLCQNYDKVYLFDVLHPTQIKHKMHKIPNVVLVEQDITGGSVKEFFDAVQMYKSMKTRKDPADFKFAGFDYPLDFNYVVSVNILNQLDILIIDYIRTYGLYSDDEIQNFRLKIQKSHYESLPEGKTCLVTDFEELVFNEKNEIEQTISLVHIDLPEDKITKRWQWEFDHQNYRAGKNVIFNVAALNI